MSVRAGDYRPRDPEHTVLYSVLGTENGGSVNWALCGLCSSAETPAVDERGRIKNFARKITGNVIARADPETVLRDWSVAWPRGVSWSSAGPGTVAGDFPLGSISFSLAFSVEGGF